MCRQKPKRPGGGSSEEGTLGARILSMDSGGGAMRGVKESCGSRRMESTKSSGRWKHHLVGTWSQSTGVRENSYTSETLENGVNLKVLRALRAGCASGWARNSVSCTPHPAPRTLHPTPYPHTELIDQGLEGAGGRSAAGQAGPGRGSPKNLWFIRLPFNCCVMVF